MAWSSYAIQTLVSCLAGSPRSGVYDTHGSRGIGSCAQVASSSTPSIRGGVVARVACSSGVATAWAFADPANCEETSSASTSRIQVRSCTLALRFGVPNGFTEMNSRLDLKGYNPRRMPVMRRARLQPALLCALFLSLITAAVGLSVQV